MSKQHQPNKYEQESLTHYDHLSTHFDRSWDGFLSGFFKRFIVKNLIMAENSSVLDIGCANGKLLSMLNEKTRIKGTGLDISPRMIKVARESYPNFDFISGSAQELPFKDSNFDLVICSASFHHFPDPAGFLEEAARVTKNGGRLIIAEIRIPLLTKLYNATITRHSHEGDVKVYSAKELLNVFEQKSWKIQLKKYSRQIQYYELVKSNS